MTVDVYCLFHTLLRRPWRLAFLHRNRVGLTGIEFVSVGLWAEISFFRNGQLEDISLQFPIEPIWWNLIYQDSIDQCPIPIISDQFLSIPINSDQCRSMPDQGIDRHLADLRGMFSIDWQWSVLIGIDRHWTMIRGVLIYAVNKWRSKLEKTTKDFHLSRDAILFQ